MREHYKIVMLPVEVPEGNHCWNGVVCCGYFDNEGGHPTCGLHLGGVVYDLIGAIKPDECLELEEE